MILLRFVKSQTLRDFPGGPEVKPSGFQWQDRILLTHTNILTYMHTYSYIIHRQVISYY